MTLVRRLLEKLLKRGQVTIIAADGTRQTYGRGGGKHLTIRFKDRKVPFELLRNPRLGLGEAYMDGRLVIEDGTMLDLLDVVTASNRWEEGGKKAIPKGRIAAAKAFFRRNDPRKARRNVAHHYDLSDELYDTFLDDDRQYSCAYFTSPGNSLEQAQADKKAHIAAKLGLGAGQRVLDIGCGWGGTALYLHRVAKVDVLGVTLSEEQLKVARQRAKDAGVDKHVPIERSIDDQLEADMLVDAGVDKHVRFELIDYRALDGDMLVDAGVLGALAGDLELLLGQSDAEHVDFGDAVQVERRAAPAAADVEHPLPRTEAELGGDVRLLVGLRLLEAVPRAGEIGAAV